MVSVVRVSYCFHSFNFNFHVHLQENFINLEKKLAISKMRNGESTNGEQGISKRGNLYKRESQKAGGISKRGNL